MKPGDKVKILSGPHSGLRGYLNCVQGSWCYVTRSTPMKTLKVKKSAVQVIEEFKLEYWLP